MKEEEYHIHQFLSRKSIDHKETEISIFVDNEVFAFAVFGKKEAEPHFLLQAELNPSHMSYRSNAERIKYLFANHDELNRYEGSVRITILNDRYTLIPNAYNNSDFSRSILQFTSGLPVTHLKRDIYQDICTAYTMDADVLSFMEGRYRNVVIRHSSSVIQELLFTSRSLRKCEILIHFSKKQFELLARQGDQLLFYNLFEYENKDDVLYYLLFMMQQYDLDPELARLGVAGNVEAQGEIMQAVAKYVRYISFAVNDVQMPQGIEWHFPDHYYFSVLNRRKCVS